MGKKGNQSKDDPLGLNQVDRVIHIEKLKTQIKAIAGEEVTFGTGAGCDPEIEEAFLEHILAFESQEGVARKI
jgi:hypothetical protein